MNNQIQYQYYQQQACLEIFKMMYGTNEIPKQGFITNSTMIKIIMLDAIRVLKKEPTVIDIDDDAVIFGDIYGDFKALRTMMKKSPMQNKPFVFLGNYIDKGEHSLDILCFLLTCKTLWPNQFILLRGNHEDCTISKIDKKYSFYKDMKERFDEGTRFCSQNF